MLLSQNTQLALIHIPLELYSSFIQPILQLLLPADVSTSHVSIIEEPLPRTTSASPTEHPFANISVTTIECSIACSRGYAKRFFAPIQEALPPSQRDAVSITHDDYVVMQVDGEGLDAGQRVLELTSPLAMAGISIFFITTYFSDYILVPVRARHTVISALESRGFAFDFSQPGTTGSYSNHRNSSSTSSFDSASGNSQTRIRTPPPATVSELQSRTFSTLKKRNVVPSLDPSLRLVQCAARRYTPSSSISDAAQNDCLHVALIRCLLSNPKFFSLTLTDTEPASLLLEQCLLPFFDTPQTRGTSNSSDDSLLMGSKTTILHPIILDLRTLPLESTGIVCGVADRLVGDTKTGPMSAVDMSYLSTARAGAVMVAEEDADRAVAALRGWETEHQAGQSVRV